MKVSLIVAVSQNDVIGKDGKIPWFVRGEQKRFKELTMNHPIIMGRKTHESIGTTLPGRLNIVISSNPGYRPLEGSKLASSYQEALRIAAKQAAAEVFVIGGQRVFEDALAGADRLYLTRVRTFIENGDKFFHFNPAGWKLISSEYYKKNEVPDRPFDFEIQLYERS